MFNLWFNAYLLNRRGYMELFLEESSLWKRRIRAPKILRFHVARNNNSLAVVEANIGGLNRTYLLDLRTCDLNPIQALDSDYYSTLSPDGHFLHFLKDSKGNQHGHRCRMPIGGGDIEDLTPGLPDYYAYRIEFSDDSKRCFFSAYKNEDVILYGLCFDNNGALTERKVLLKTNGNLGSIKLSRDGKFVAITSPKNNENDETKILLLNADSGIEYKQLKFASATVAYVNLFIPFSNKMILTTENGEHKKFCLWDYEKDSLEEIFTNLNKEIRIVDISKDGKKILIQVISQAVDCHIIYKLDDDSFVSLENQDGVSYPSYILEDEVLLLSSSSQHKSRILSYCLNTGRLKKILFEPPGSVPARCAKSIRFTGARCDQVQGWLRIPDGKGPFPTIIELPGGPDCACSWYESDVYLEHGFAKLTINYHGSSSFGLDFQKSIVGRVGQLELEDMVAARSWLIQQGFSKPDQIFLMGGSYGGYLTLWGMVKRPDLWKAGLARVPIADFVAAFEDENGSLKRSDIHLFGGSPNEKPELYINSSPITYIENLKAPLQIIAGLNDTRCPKRQIDLFVEKGRMLGKDIETYWYDQGHSSNSANELIHQTELRLKFLKKVMTE